MVGQTCNHWHSDTGRGSRSCVLVSFIFYCVWKTNCWIILWLLDFWMFVFQDSHFLIISLEFRKDTWQRWQDRLTIIRQLDFNTQRIDPAIRFPYTTGRESPGWGDSWFYMLFFWSPSRRNSESLSQRWRRSCKVVYYESRKREVKTRPMYECRCDERLKTKPEKSAPLTYTGLIGELEHLRSRRR